MRVPTCMRNILPVSSRYGRYSSVLLRSFSVHLPGYMVSKLRRPQYESSPSLNPQMLRIIFFPPMSRNSAFWKEDRITYTNRTTKPSIICSVGGLMTRLSKASRPIVGTSQPPIHRISTALSLGIKCVVREARHTAPSNTELINAQSSNFS